MNSLIIRTKIQKSNIGWPQQPPIEKVHKNEIVFHDSTPKFIFSKYQNKAEIQNMDDSEVLIFQALEPLQPQ